jgi:hypothetical protein
MLGSVVFRELNLRVRHAVGRIEHSQLESRGEEALDGGIDLGLGDFSVFHRLNQRRIFGVAQAAGGVGTCLHRQYGSRCEVRREPVAAGDVGDGSAVGGDVAGELPVVAENVFEQHGVGAGRLAIDGVVGAHDRVGVGLGDGGAEGGQIGVPEIVGRDVNVGGVARRFRPAVDGVVLGSGDHFKVFGVIALHGFNKRDTEAAGEIRVFAVGFLASAPARVAKDIDVGRPEIQTVIDAVVVVGDRVAILGAGLGGDDLGLVVDEVGVPGGGHPDRLGKDGGVSRARYAVQAFTPPVVGGNAEVRDGRRVVLHLRDFFFEGHLRDQVRDPPIGGQSRILPVGSSLREQAQGETRNNIERNRDKCFY